MKIYMYLVSTVMFSRQADVRERLSQDPLPITRRMSPATKPGVYLGSRLDWWLLTKRHVLMGTASAHRITFGSRAALESRHRFFIRR